MHSFGGSGAEQATLADQGLSSMDYTQTHTETHTYIESPTEAKQIWTCRHTKAKLEAQTRTYAQRGTHKKLTDRC